MMMLKQGQRVRIKSLNLKGKIFYIDQQNYYRDHFAPIQIELDKPYDESGQMMYRTSVKDIVKLKKKKKKPKKETFIWA